MTKFPGIGGNSFLMKKLYGKQGQCANSCDEALYHLHCTQEAVSMGLGTVQERVHCLHIMHQHDMSVCISLGLHDCAVCSNRSIYDSCLTCSS